MSKNCFLPLYGCQEVKNIVDSRLSLGWVGKEGETYPDGDRMAGGSQNHFPHYHSHHYVETDPLMDHTQGSNQVRGKPEQCVTKDKRGGRVDWQEANRSTAHKTHTKQWRKDSQFSFKL